MENQNSDHGNEKTILKTIRLSPRQNALFSRLATREKIPYAEAVRRTLDRSILQKDEQSLLAEFQKIQKKQSTQIDQIVSLISAILDKLEKRDRQFSEQEENIKRIFNFSLYSYRALGVQMKNNDSPEWKEAKDKILSEKWR